MLFLPGYLKVTSGTDSTTRSPLSRAAWIAVSIAEISSLFVSLKRSFCQRPLTKETPYRIPTEKTLCCTGITILR